MKSLLAAALVLMASSVFAPSAHAEISGPCKTAVDANVYPTNETRCQVLGYAIHLEGAEAQKFMGLLTKAGLPTTGNSVISINDLVATTVETDHGAGPTVQHYTFKLTGGKREQAVQLSSDKVKQVKVTKALDQAFDLIDAGNVLSRQGSDWVYAFKAPTILCQNDASITEPYCDIELERAR